MILFGPTYTIVSFEASVFGTVCVVAELAVERQKVQLTALETVLAKVQDTQVLGRRFDFVHEEIVGLDRDRHLRRM